MRAWAGTAGIGPPCLRLLDLRHTPRCIMGLSFCLHFAEPKIGSALVTRCCLPPLSFSISRSFAPSFSLYRAFAYSDTKNDPFGPKSTSAFLSLPITRAGARCSMLVHFQTQSAAFASIRSISERSLLPTISPRTTTTTTTSAPNWCRGIGYQKPKRLSWNDMETSIMSTFIVIRAARTILSIAINSMRIAVPSECVPDRGVFIRSCARGCWFPRTSSSSSSSSFASSSRN